MARDVSVWLGAEDAVHAYWDISFVVQGVPSLSTLTFRSAGVSAPDDSMLSSRVAVGPELDWRNGVSSWSPVTISVPQGFSSVAATSTNNAFEYAAALREWEAISGSYVSHYLNDAGECTLFLSAGTSSPSGGLGIFGGYVTNISQADHGGLVIEMQPKRELYLNSPFLSILGAPASTVSGEGNVDIRAASVKRPLNEDAEQDFVPIIYGRPNYAKAVVPHLKPTVDLTNNGYGLVVVLSDNKYTTPKTVDPELFIPGSTNRDPIPVEIADYDGDTQYEWISGTNVIRIGGTAGVAGAVIGFTDDPDRAGSGLLLARRQIPLIQAGGQNNATLVLTEIDDDDTTFVSTTSLTPGGIAGFFVNAQPDDEVQAEFYRAFLRIKFGTDANTTWQTPTMGLGVSSGVPGVNQSIGSVPTSNLIFNNWTSGTGYEIGFVADASTGFTRPSGGLVFGLNFDQSVYSSTTQIDVYGGVADVWYALPWERYWKRLFGTVDGINDATYRYDSTGYLKNPAEIAAHFIAEVLGGAINSTSFSTASGQMDADGVRLDFQLTEGNETGGDVLEKIATQGMCWIHSPGGDEEEIIYRPGITGTDAAATNPYNATNIIKGSFNWSLTPRDDVYRTVVVNYARNAITGQFDGQKIIAPTAGPYTTNVDTDATTYTAFADSINAANARPLIVNADLIQDDATAERFCKWLALMHGVRRQVIEFDTFAASVAVTTGDMIYCTMPQVRSYASGDALTYSVGDVVSNATTFEPSADTTNKGFGAVHDQDLLVIESGSYAGTYRLGWNGTDFDVTPNTIFGIGTFGITDPWRVVPGFDVLSAQVVYDREFGPRVHIRAVEHPVFLPRTNDL